MILIDNKRYLLLSLMSFFITLCGMAATTSTFSVDGIYYNVLSGTTCEVTNSLGGSSLTESTASATLQEGATKTLVIPSTVTYEGLEYSVVQIGKYAFQWCADFTEIEIPASVKTISSRAFANNRTLKKVDIPSGVSTISSYAFEKCPSLISVSISSTVRQIGDNAFAGCDVLSTIKVDDSNTYYDSREDCNAVIITKSNVLSFGCMNSTIPEGVVKVGDNAFYQCTGLKEVVFPSSLKTIGEMAFYNCSSLASIFISANITEIGLDAFYGCPNIKSITVDKGNTIFDSRDNCNAIIETSTNTLVMGCGQTVIPEGVVTIGSGAFDGCKGLVSITLPNTVKTVGYNAFGSSSIQRFDGGNSLVTISDRAFNYCYSLTEVIVPSTVTSIGYLAFYDCTALTSFINYSAEPQTLQNTFDSTPAYKVLHVCNGCSPKYKSSSGWNEFTVIEDLESSDIILNDGEPYTETEDQYSKTIRYVRNYQNTSWQALYIPFSLSYADWSKNFEVAYINNFHNYDTDGDGEFDYVQLEVCRIKKGSLIPNNPYLIKAKEVGEQTLTASNATLYAAAENSLDCSTVTNRYVFTGTYSSVERLDQKGYFFMSDGDLCNTTRADAVLSPYRWYMCIEKRNTQYYSLAKNVRYGIFVGDEDDGSLDITDMVSEAEQCDSSVFDMSGRKLGKDISNLPKGIYIVNKHKFIKK